MCLEGILDDDAGMSDFDNNVTAITKPTAKVKKWKPFFDWLTTRMQSVECKQRYADCHITEEEFLEMVIYQLNKCGKDNCRSISNEPSYYVITDWRSVPSWMDKPRDYDILDKIRITPRIKNYKASQTVPALEIYQKSDNSYNIQIYTDHLSMIPPKKEQLSELTTAFHHVYGPIPIGAVAEFMQHVMNLAAPYNADWKGRTFLEIVAVAC